MPRGGRPAVPGRRAQVARAWRSSPRRPRSSRRGCRGRRRSGPSRVAASAPGSAEPLTGDDPQRSGGRSGRAPRPAARGSAGASPARRRARRARAGRSARSVPSGSKLRVQHERRGRAAIAERAVREAPGSGTAGAAIIVVSRALSGIFDSSAAAGPSDPGLARSAPFGVPVVPEVRITDAALLGRAAAGWLSRRARSGPRAAGRRALARSSCQATKRLRRSPASSIDLGELLVVDDRLRAPRARRRR